LVTGLFAIFAPDSVLPLGQASHYGYGQTFAVFGVMLLSFVAVPVGFLIAQLTSISIHRRELARDFREACVKESLAAQSPLCGSPKMDGSGSGGITA
jgi:hypothetical protein